MKFRLVHVLLIGCMGLLISCSSSDKVENSPNEGITPESFTFFMYDAGSGDPARFPLPNDILRNPTTGQVAFPLTMDPVVDALIAQVNTLNGFSTSGLIRLPFDGELNPDSVNASTVFLVDLAHLSQLPPADAAQAIRPVTFNHTLIDEVITFPKDENGSTVLMLRPIFPLSPGHPHMVVVTSGVTDTEGKPVESDSAMLALKAKASLVGGPAEGLEPVRQAYAALWPAAEALTGQDRLFIPGMFAFSTQTQHSTMQSIYELAQLENPTPNVVTATLGVDEVDALYNLLGQGFIPHNAIGGFITGSFDAPQYISNNVSGWIQTLENPHYETINFLATLPAGPSPLGGNAYPVLIFQHGITSSKETFVAIANSAASVGFATIAIDLVLHGERSIDADGNGEIDPSGATFINLANVLLSRDNVRQSSSDLMVLTRMITSGAADFTGDGVADLSPGAVTFVGHSLGGVVGSSFAMVDPNVGAAVLSQSGARVPAFLLESAAFGPRIRAGLADFGLAEGTSLFDIYNIFAQAIFDDADPINYLPYSNGALSGGVPTAVLLQAVLGDGVVPNSGTYDMAYAMRAPQVDALVEVPLLAQVSSPHLGNGLYQFSSPADPGQAHGALLDPSGGNPTVAFQTQVFNFLGTALLGSPTIVNPNGKVKIETNLDIYRGLEEEIKVETLNFFPGLSK